MLGNAVGTSAPVDLTKEEKLSELRSIGFKADEARKVLAELESSKAKFTKDCDEAQEAPDATEESLKEAKVELDGLLPKIDSASPICLPSKLTSLPQKLSKSITASDSAVTIENIKKEVIHLLLTCRQSRKILPS